MRKTWWGLAIIGATWTTIGDARADPRAESISGWTGAPMWGLGTRASSWVGPYAAPGLGGHIDVRPWEHLGIELFSDNFATRQDGAWRHDHVIGFSLYAPSLLAGRGWFVAPTFGTCVDFRFAHPERAGAPGVSDVLFGVHGGLEAEVFVLHGFAFELQATVFGYVGNDVGIERWTARVSNDLGGGAVGQVTGGLSYWF